MRKTSELHVVRRMWENVRTAHLRTKSFRSFFFLTMVSNGIAHNVIAVQCSECQSGVRSSRQEQARVNDRRNHDNVIAVQCSECQSGEKFKTNAGKRLVLCCCGVLLCCDVCVVRHAEKLHVVNVHVGVTIFAHVLEKNALLSMMFAFRSL